MKGFTHFFGKIRTIIATTASIINRKTNENKIDNKMTPSDTEKTLVPTYTAKMDVNMQPINIINIYNFILIIVD